MADKPTLLKPATAAELQRLLDHRDHGGLPEPIRSHNTSHGVYIVQVLEGGRDMNGFYGGVIFNANDGALEWATFGYVREVTDYPLAAGNRYLVRRAGVYNTYPCFHAQVFTIVRPIKCLSSTPSSGQYPGLMLEYNLDGTLTEVGALAVFIRDGNNAPALFAGEIYNCVQTGFDLIAGTYVFTVCDYNMIVRNQGGSIQYNRIFNEWFGPDFTWNITQPDVRSALIKRVWDLRRAGSLMQTDVWEMDLWPSANHWTINLPGPGRATIDRALWVHRTGETPTGMSIYDIQLAPQHTWLVINDGIGAVVVERLLRTELDGGSGYDGIKKHTLTPQYTWELLNTGPGDVKLRRLLSAMSEGGQEYHDLKKYIFSPGYCWDVVLTAPGDVAIQRKLAVRKSGGAAFNHIKEIEFAPSPAWEVEQGAGAGDVKVKRVLDVEEAFDINTVHDTHKISFFPSASWLVDGEDGQAIVRRALDILEGGSRRTTNTCEMDFNGTDFTVIRRSEEKCGIETEGLTGTIPVYRYCCSGSTLHEVSGSIVVTHGLVKSFSGYPSCP